MSQRIVIGLGSGRCGTVSLSRFLDCQLGTTVLHEGCQIYRGRRVRQLPRLPWAVSLPAFSTVLDSLAQAPAAIAGDVASYYLPYMRNYLTESTSSRLRIIVLQRQREATVQSFLVKTRGRNHWSRNPIGRWRPDSAWDPCFPKYSEMGKAEAIGKYYDEYYATCEELAADFPEQLRIFAVQELNGLEGRQRILDFIGVPLEARVIDRTFWENRLVSARKADA